MHLLWLLALLNVLRRLVLQAVDLLCLLLLVLVLLLFSLLNVDVVGLLRWQLDFRVLEEVDAVVTDELGYVTVQVGRVESGKKGLGVGSVGLLLLLVSVLVVQISGRNCLKTTSGQLTTSSNMRNL